MCFREERRKILQVLNIRLIGFDYKKIEQYKQAIDDDFGISGFISGIEYITLRKDENGYYFFELKDTSDGEILVKYRIEDWEEFKKKIRITFEGDEVEDDF